MRILYIGTKSTYHFYQQGINPSHWLYGAVEMEKEGNDVIWENESRSLINDIHLVKIYQPDKIFIPNLNLRNHFLLLLLTAVGFMRTPILVYLHHEPKVKKGLKSFFYKLLLRAPEHLFFLSQKTMEETVKVGLVDSKKCSVPGWGPDKFFFERVPKNQGKWFVSTGKENRDFDILIEAFKRTGAPLKIMTAKSHAGNSYENLIEKCKDIPNIEVVITENTGNIYPQMLEAMANARALVCPLRQDKLNYCVGLSTIADAIGLSKPLIITYNPYHDILYTGCMHQVVSVEDWIEAIRVLSDKTDNNLLDLVNIQKCYKNMKKQMFK